MILAPVHNEWFTAKHLEHQYSSAVTTIDLPNLTLVELTQFVAATLHMNDDKRDEEEEVDDDDDDDDNQSLQLQQRLQQLHYYF